MSLRLKKVAVFGEGIFSRSPVVTRQRRLNCYLEIRKDGDKSSVVCYGTPGMRPAFNIASSLQDNPARGLIGNDTALYTVAGNMLKRWSSAGVQVGNGGAISTNTGAVGMALNPTQVIVVDGAYGYIYTPAVDYLNVIGGAFPNGARTVCYCNGFFVAELPGTNQFFVSTLNDGNGWNGLSYGTAVQAIDGIKAVDTLGGLLIVFSAGHLEFWQNVGASPEPFQYIQNSASMYGLQGTAARVHAGEQLIFLAHTNGGSFQNAGGSFQICRIKGYSVGVISTTDIDNILQQIARTSTLADCTAFSYQVDEHIFAQFNFPSANRSLLLNVTNETWSEVQSGVTAGYAARHIGNLSCGAYDQTYIADASNGNLYIPDPTVYTDNGSPIVREVVSRCALDDFNTLRISAILLDMQTGVGLSDPTLQGYDPQVEISIARDNRDFGAPRRIALGKAGQYVTRIFSRRWGRARTANLKIRMTDPVPFVLTSGAIMTRSRSSGMAGGARRAA